jgi:hypothetical protein
MTNTRSPEALHGVVVEAVRSLIDDKSVRLDDATPLVGSDSVLDSMRLVELCLALEDAARERGFEFDWTSDAAMSRSRGMFRSVGALAGEFAAQAGKAP